MLVQALTNSQNLSLKNKTVLKNELLFFLFLSFFSSPDSAPMKYDPLLIMTLVKNNDVWIMFLFISKKGEREEKNKAGELKPTIKTPTLSNVMIGCYDVRCKCFSHSLHFVSDAVRQSGFSNITGHIFLSELLS